MPDEVTVPFNPQREESELREYLGEAFDRAKLENYEKLVNAEAERVGDEAAFYRTSTSYLYDLTVFAMSGTKMPYLQLLTSRVPRGSRILDYGCGIGSDGLMLLESGYEVEFADFDNPSTQYLRWRLEHRGLDAPIHNLDDHVPGGFDAAYSFDVIEHVADPLAFLAELERRAALVEVNLLEYDSHDHLLHHRLPILRLLGHAARRGLIDYRVEHGSSHVILYRSASSSATALVRSAAVLGSGSLRHRFRQKKV